jgi:hypothetical protein
MKAPINTVDLTYSDESVDAVIDENDRLRACLLIVRAHLDDISDHPEPADTIKLIDEALSTASKQEAR